MLVNSFVPVSGRADELIARHVADTLALGLLAAEYGWRSNRVYREHDGRSMIVVTAFATGDHHRRWLDSDEFRRHRDHLGELLADARSTPCDLVAATGVV